MCVMYKVFKISSQRGDTLVEVMFASAVAALVIVGALSVMNKSLSQTQLSVEVTQVRQAVDRQAELLRYSRDAYKKDEGAASGGSKVWQQVITKSKPAASSFGSCASAANLTNNSNGDNAFFVNASNINDIQFSTTFTEPQTFAQEGSGLWVEAVRGSREIAKSDGSTVKYMDLHIRACWDTSVSGEKSKIGTIVRLYYETK